MYNYGGRDLKPVLKETLVTDFHDLLKKKRIIYSVRLVNRHRLHLLHQSNEFKRIRQTVVTNQPNNVDGISEEYLGV